MDDIDQADERRSMMALSAAMGAGHQFMRMMAEGDTAPPEPPKSTGRSRMAAIVALRAANWTKDRGDDNTG